MENNNSESVKEAKISFVTEDGDEVTFEVVEETRLGGVRYLLVLDEIEGEDSEALILKDSSSETDTESVYEIVEDEKEISAVAKVFEELLGDTELVTD